MSDQGGPTPTDVIARNCIAVRLRLLNRVVTNLYDDARRPVAYGKTGVSPGMPNRAGSARWELT